MSKILICPTPIGNLEDITLRVLRALKEADVIACEDTRHTMKLLSHYGIQKPLISFHEHNEKERLQKLIRMAEEGKKVVVVSDAGMPGIQDPGALLIRALVEEGREFSVLPGASALITAAVGSALAREGFLFVGFLPQKSKQRKEILLSLAACSHPIIFYEAPHRLHKLLEELNDILGSRSLVLARELTKKYEEYIHTTTEEAVNTWKDKAAQGEFVVIVEGNQEGAKESSEGLPPKQAMDLLLQSGMSKKDAAAVYSKITGFSKNKAYKIALQMQEDA